MSVDEIDRVKADGSEGEDDAEPVTSDFSDTDQAVTILFDDDDDDSASDVEGRLNEMIEGRFLLPHLPGNSGGLAPYDPLAVYLREIRGFPKLSREEEQHLAIRYREHGDQIAGYKLVMANLSLVVMVAREYRRNLKNILDLIQEGNIGLLEAVKQFDPYRGIRFPTYAIYWIRAYMLRFLINNVRLVKVGTTQAQRKLFFNLKKEQERLEAEGFAPEAKLLAERLRVKESEVIEMQQRLALPDLSVDAPLSGSDDGGADYHSIMASAEETSEELVAEADFNEVLHQAMRDYLKIADEKEQAIIERRLMAEEPETLQDIANDFSVSRERIRQIESSLKKKLKPFLKERLQLDEDGGVDIE
ncbi:MAG: RNA polymerase factor sigma-32 [bacterium]|nr:RNA polymerase factor sigma-32 [bacterium]